MNYKINAVVIIVVLNGSTVINKMPVLNSCSMVRLPSVERTWGGRFCRATNMQRVCIARYVLWLDIRLSDTIMGVPKVV